MALDLPESNVLDFVDFSWEALPSLKRGRRRNGGKEEGAKGEEGTVTGFDM